MEDFRTMETKFKDAIDRAYRVNGKKEPAPGVVFSSIALLCEESNADDVNGMVKKWLTEKGIKIVTVTAEGYEIPKEKLNIRYGSENIYSVIYPGDEKTDELKEENTVLFLPDLDKMRNLDYRRLLLDMGRQHIVADPRNGEGGYAKLAKSFCMVATVGKMEPNAAFELLTMDAKDSFRRMIL